MRYNAGVPAPRLLAAVALVGVVSCSTSAPQKPAGTTPEPAKSPLGSDVSELPLTFSKASWLPIDAPLLSMRLQVPVVVNGVKATATLDTGATDHVMSKDVAARFAVRADVGTPVDARDAYGSHVAGVHAPLGTVALGKHVFDNQSVNVIDGEGVFLIGYSVLSRLDLYIAAEQALVGVFAAGQAPLDGFSTISATTTPASMWVELHAPGKAGGKTTDVMVPMLVDTGAFSSAIPMQLGARGGLPVDLQFAVATVSASGENEERGRFIASDVTLGSERVAVGRIIAIPGTIDLGESMGLLGNDVLFRRHTVVSPSRALLAVKDVPTWPASRSRGPGGVVCGSGAAPVPCVNVQMMALPADTVDGEDDLPGVCLQIDVDAAYVGRTVEMAVTAVDGGVFAGGAIEAFLSVGDDGAHHCFRLWKGLTRLGFSAATPLSVRWFRADNARFPCDPLSTRCLLFSGPLPK
jgi:predicted aspartyl protease